MTEGHTNIYWPMTIKRRTARCAVVCTEVQDRAALGVALTGCRRIGASTVRIILDHIMIHELFPFPTETAFGSHPCRVVSVTYRKLRPFHGADVGSNPAGDAKSIT